MAETFIMRKEWLDNIAELPVGQQDTIIAEIVRYGAGLEPRHEQDAIVQAFVNMIKGRMDSSICAYNQKVEMSKTAGRKKKVDDEAIYELAKNGKSSIEIAEELGYSKSAVDHSDGWRNRKGKL